MACTKNDITGDSIKSKPTTDLYRDNWDKIFNSDKDKVYLEQVDGYFNIIVSSENNENCFIRLNEEQFKNLILKLETFK